MESVFPDFLQLVASNLRAGMTVDKALIVSAREEFNPLDEEIILAAKDLVTGKEIDEALNKMAKRTGSERIKKTVGLILTGIKSGGNLSILLEETSTNMRERIFVEKRAASSVLMYMIFIFFAVAIGAPVLFALSSILVEVLSDLLSGFPQVSDSGIDMPLMTVGEVNISANFIIWYCIIFLVVIDVLASLILGLVGKGKEGEGLKYTIPLILLSLGIFFGVRSLLSGFFSGLIG
jgi:flagellar protein FlaJ